jgi:4-aminobutyrate aminotransferase-like enzyme/Ser/Thr protein kinase RdoA (MazF antagonist)
MQPTDPLEASPPRVPLEEAAAGAEELFGLAGRAAALDSERDQNLRLECNDGRVFLLKISNPADDRAVLQMQTKALLHIARADPGLPVMQPVPTTGGGYIAELYAGGTRHRVRAFTFLPGRTAASTEMDPVALRAFGGLVARMGLALRGFFHEAAGYEILWDLKLTPRLRPLLDAIGDPVRRALVARVLDRFDEVVRPALPRLRAQLVHNDLTLDNVLLDESHRAGGIVDFGDLTHTLLVCDLAVALVSLMWGRDDPFEAAEHAIGGYRSIVPLEREEAAVLGDLVAARLAALVTIAAWRAGRHPENAAYITANEDLAWDLLEHIDGAGWTQASARLRDACLGVARGGRPAIEELSERRRRVLGPALSALSYDRPLYLVRGEGSRVFDDRGRVFLDAYNNVPVVGHCHSRVVAAIAEQAAALNTNTRYLHENVVVLAERLVGTMPEGLDTVMFVNSGSEANDIAWRLATAYTGGGGGIVTARAYHGVTAATAALSPEEWSARPGHVATVSAPDGYRGHHHYDEPGWPERYAAHADEAIAELDRRGLRPAAFYVDPLFTSDGIFSPPPAYLVEVARRVHEAGFLLVADEVQAGYGRTGSHLWSFQASGITPDLVTLGKPMGNGHPVAAVVTRSEIAERFASETDLFSTFGGNPVACAAALATLDVLEDEGLQRHAAEVGAHLRRDLEELARRHQAIGEVRGAGLMVGVELVADPGERSPASALTRAVVNAMKDKGILVGSTGPDDNVVKIRPPLVLSRSEAGAIVSALDEALAEAEQSLRPL